MSIKRLDYIDEIRGIAILLVVVGHIIQFNGISKIILFLNLYIVSICHYSLPSVAILHKK